MIYKPERKLHQLDPITLAVVAVHDSVYDAAAKVDIQCQKIQYALCQGISARTHLEAAGFKWEWSDKPNKKYAPGIILKDEEFISYYEKRYAKSRTSVKKKRTEPNMSLNKFARLIRLEIKRRNPEYFNVAWIRKYVHTKPHDLMRKNGCGFANGNIEWEDLLDLMPEQRHLWRYKPQIERTIGQAIAELLLLLNSEKPSSFGPRWIKDNNQPAFIRIKNYCNGDWMKLKNKLPEPWRNRITYQGIPL